MLTMRLSEYVLLLFGLVFQIQYHRFESFRCRGLLKAAILAGENSMSKYNFSSLGCRARRFVWASKGRLFRQDQ